MFIWTTYVTTLSGNVGLGGYKIVANTEFT